MLKLLLYDAQCGIETLLLWPTGTWLLLHGREQKEESTIGLDTVAVPIEHEETTSVAPVHLGLETPDWLAGAGSRGYGPETCYNRALMLAEPDDASYCRRCSRLEILNSDYIQHLSYGARGFMRVPVSEANDLNYLL